MITKYKYQNFILSSCCSSFLLLTCCSRKSKNDELLLICCSKYFSKVAVGKGLSVYLLLSVHVSANKRRISPPNFMPILCDEVVAEVGEG